ncbi:MAG: hypothetical protein ACTSSE_15930 [Candidatus Thorarchaeota archaeon]
MEQEIEVTRTLENLKEFGMVFIYAIVIAFVLEGLLFICILIYSIFLYRFVVWMQWHEYIGMVITYTMFIVTLVVMLHILHKFLHFSKRSLLRGFSGTMALFSIVFPITPISWYIDNQTSPEQLIGFSYGVEYQLWPLLCLVGFTALVILITDLLSIDGTKSYKTMLIFSGFLGVLTTLVTLLVLSVPIDTGFIDNWATPFFILPHVAGLVVLLESVSQYIGTRKKPQLQQPKKPSAVSEHTA